MFDHAQLTVSPGESEEGIDFPAEALRRYFGKCTFFVPEDSSGVFTERQIHMRTPDGNELLFVSVMQNNERLLLDEKEAAHVEKVTRFLSAEFNRVYGPKQEDA